MPDLAPSGPHLRHVVLRLSHTTCQAPSRLRGEQIVQERHEIGLSAAIADGANDLAGSDVERRDQAFVPCRIYSNSRRSTWPASSAGLGGAFQRLDTGHLVNRNSLAALFGGGGAA